MKTTRGFLLALTLALALALVACGGAAPGSAPASGSGEAAAGTFESEGRQYITADQLKADIEAGEDMYLLDIQLKEAYDAGHLEGAVATYAFPVDTDEAKAKIDAVLGDVGDKPLIIICPGGKGGANNTWDYLSSIDYDMGSAFILENGQNGWPFPELLAGE
jgi:thiosulfate/3-mercaptopyruvate sulfurtransferase